MLWGSQRLFVSMKNIPRHICRLNLSKKDIYSNFQQNLKKLPWDALPDMPHCHVHRRAAETQNAHGFLYRCLFCFCEDPKCSRISPSMSILVTAKTQVLKNFSFAVHSCHCEDPDAQKFLLRCLYSCHCKDTK